MLDEHVYYWAWREEDNAKLPANAMPSAYRVFRATNSSRGKILTDIMTREEAEEYCKHIVNLTGGREI
jgi:hypothetical protein